MEFKLPEIHDLRVEIEGRRFDGCWYIVGDDMVVNYNGYTASTRQRQTNADDIAQAMLRDLVEKHYVRLESISTSVPQPIRLAAHRYVNASDEESAAQELVASFGDSTAGTLAHRQLSWLCVNGASMVVPAWKFMCDGNAAEETLNDLREWLQNPLHAVDWATAIRPAVGRRNGIPVGDCDACRLEPTADAVASTARYLQTADPADAATALLSASYAYSEGCHSEEAPERFEKWLVFDLLLPALECKPVGGFIS